MKAQDSRCSSRWPASGRCGVCPRGGSRRPVTQGLPVTSPPLGTAGLGLRGCSGGQALLVFSREKQTPLLTCLVSQFL